MSNAVARITNVNMPSLAMDEKELMDVLRNSLYLGAADASIKMVIGYCKASGLDPMQKPVHLVPMWDSKAGSLRDVVMPGIGLYRTQAARSGNYAGVSEPEYGADVTAKIGGVEITYPAWCRVVVKRLMANGAIAEFAATERWLENYAVKGGKEKSVAPNAMWSRRPYGQIAKCAEAQALRKAFPEFGAQPTADEVEGKTLDDFQGATIDGGTGEVVNKKPALETCSAEKFSENKAAWRKAVESGKKSPDDLIATLSTKCVLSAEQKAEIKGWAKAEEPTTGAPVVTFAQVAEKLNRADGLDVLDLAADLIGEVADPAQRKELGELFKSRQAELSQ